MEKELYRYYNRKVYADFYNELNFAGPELKSSVRLNRKEVNCCNILITMQNGGIKVPKQVAQVFHLVVSFVGLEAGPVCSLTGFVMPTASIARRHKMKKTSLPLKP
jgi:hypothetical protein